MSRTARLLLFALIPLAGVGGVTFGAFSNSTVNPANTVAADLVYPAPRSTTAWGVTDAADSSPADVSNPVAFDDDSYLLTKSWPPAFNSNNYVELRLAGPLPVGISSQAASFEFDFADERNNPRDEICFYFDVRRASTGAVLATHGGPSSPIACQARRTVERTSTPLPELVSSNQGNDLAIRVYAAHSRSDQMRLHRATVEFAAAGNTWTLDELRLDDRADGSPSQAPWSLAFADGVELTTSNWASSFAGNRYLEVRFPVNHVPTGAVVDSAELTHRYRSQSPGRTFCYWLEVFSGTTLLGTHGSAGSPLACSSSGSLVTDTVSLPELGGGNASALSVRIRGRSSPVGQSFHDRVELTVNYSLPAGS